MAEIGNRFALGNNGGRPLKYEKPEDLEKVISEYFDHCIAESEHVTITGLALFCGFADKCSLYDYEKRTEFSHLIKRARTVVEYFYEKDLRTGFIFAGAIFALKNMGWADKQNIDHTTGGESMKSGLDLNTLDADELLQFQQLAKKAAVKKPDEPA